LLIVFDSIDGAVRCAINVQQQTPRHDGDQPPERAIRFRIGINIGDVIADGMDLHGDSVNVAARLQAECPPGGICVSRAVHDHVHSQLGLTFVELGALSLKNIARPVEAFVLRLELNEQKLPSSTPPPHPTGGIAPPPPSAAVMPNQPGDDCPRNDSAVPGFTLSVAEDGSKPRHAILPTLEEKPSIAVLPFQNLSGDADQDYFVDGIVEDITIALSRFSALLVIARNSAFTYKGRAVDVRQIGRELGVRYVLDGSVRRAFDRLRLVGQLIQAETGAHLWAERYDRKLDDIFALQDDLATSVVSALVPTLEHSELTRSRRKPTQNLDAYDLYLRALFAYRKNTREGNEQAQDTLTRVLELDPKFVPGLLLADACCSIAYYHGWMPQRETLAQSMQKVRLALQIEPGNAEALAALARHVVQASGDPAEAMALAEQASAANPNDWLAMRVGGFALLNASQPERALVNFERAQRLSPRDSLAYQSWNGIAFALVELGRHEEAEAAGRNAVRTSPDSATALRALAAALALGGKLGEARMMVRRILDVDPNCSLESLTVWGANERTRPAFVKGLRAAGLPERPKGSISARSASLHD
jgi:adenylate cyclase